MPGPQPPWRIAVIAATVLVLELAFIRQVPAEVRAIAYFTNLLLMAAFFGLGLGCILAQRRSLAGLLPLGLVLVAAFVLAARGLVIHDEARAVHYWLQYEENLAGTARRLPLFGAALVAFVCAATPFVAMGQALARAMDAHPRLVAYGWDVAGSLAGTVLFAIASWLQLPPWLWPPLVGATWALLFVRAPAARAACVLAGCAFLVFSQSPHESRWSPYYLVQVREEAGGLRVWVNSSFHQLAIDFTAQEERIVAIRQHLAGKLGLPYRVYRRLHEGRAPDKVLVLGAGTGNDVVVALAQGAREVVAVEIDPVILELGRERNASRPYDDPRVRTVVDDARHFLQTSDETFDLVLLGTLDSQTLLSGHANLRLENYVYTREAFEQVRRRLAPDGLAAAYYSVMQPWLYGRLYATVRAAFGPASRMYELRSPFLFDTVIVAGDGVDSLPPAGAQRLEGARPSTDDWPFVYLERPTIAPLYRNLFAAVAVLVGGVFVLLRRLHPVTGLHASFFFLGAGFSLVESAAIVRLALLFGGTWVVNAVVFAAVLATIFVANASVLRGQAPPLRASWLGLFAGILANGLFPLAMLLALPVPLRVAACAVLVGTPVYFAGVCFSRLFARQRTTGYALGMNLVGVMLGGVLEYASMALGMRGVWAVALVVYVLAFATARRPSASAGT